MIRKEKIANRSGEDEEGLIRKAQADSNAFRPLYEKYFKDIFLFVHNRVGDKSLTADITSQVFLKALLNLNKFELRGFPFSAWLFRIALNEQYLDDLANALIDNPELKVKLVGHTDNVGSEKFNLKLSNLRAEALRTHLVGKGIDQERIITEGKGMSEPIKENTTEEGRATNRRVEMTILYDE